MIRYAFIIGSLAILASAFARQAGAQDDAGTQDEATPPSAYLVSIPLPISGPVDEEVKRRVDQVLEVIRGKQAQGETERPILVLEFGLADENENSAGAASEFGRCISLADYLSGPKLKRVRTVAYLPNDLRGHAILAALACEELVMAPEAKLGPIRTNDAGEAPLTATHRAAYEDIQSRRGVLPAPIIAAMLDPQVKVLRVMTAAGPRYATSAEVASIEAETTVSEVKTITSPGQSASFTGERLRYELNLIPRVAEDRKQLAVELRLRPGSLSDDPSLGEAWRAVHFQLEGPIQASDVRWLQRSLEEKRVTGAINYICVSIDSAGGSPADSMQMARYLAALNPREVQTVAYIQHSAIGDAAYVALACDQIVMAADAQLGGAGAHVLNQRQRDSLASDLKSLAESKGRDWSLMAALVDSEMEVFRYRHRTTRAERLLTEQEWEDDPAPDRWEQGEQVELSEGLRGDEALELGVATSLAADFEQFRADQHLNEPLQELAPNWAHRFVEALSAKWIARMLLFFAISLLITEVSQPGLSVPGFLSATFFALFFWSQFLHGSASGLEIILFVVGLVFILLEIFIVPGFGVFGIGGILMMLGSIVLASQTFVIPQNEYQATQLLHSLSLLLAGGLGGCVTIYLLRRFLPHTPMFRHMMLLPVGESELAERQRRESLVAWDHLASKCGETVTVLAPSGKARFGDEVVAVISEGEMIGKGEPIRVLDVVGNRVVVSAMEKSS